VLQIQKGVEIKKRSAHYVLVIPHTGKGSQFQPDKVFRHPKVVNGHINYFSHIIVIFGPDKEGRAGRHRVPQSPFFVMLMS
jgi:hypothetical protein